MQHEQGEESINDKGNRYLSSWVKAWIDKDQHWLEYQLLALALATGIIDVVSFPKYHCFTSNQTGNTVLFAVTAFSLFGTRQQSNFQAPAPHLAVSLGFFCLGVFVPGQVSNRLNSKSSRWWLLLTNMVQTAMVWSAALIDHLYIIREQENTWPILCVIGLLAFSAGAQVAMSRQLDMPEIPTTQATAAYVDLFVDPKFFGSITQNRSRNRRIAFLFTLVVGSFIGAPAYQYVSSAFTIFLAGLIKALVTVSFGFNKTCIR